LIWTVARGRVAVGQDVVGEGEPGRGVVELDVAEEGRFAGEDDRGPEDEEHTGRRGNRPPRELTSGQRPAEREAGHRQGDRRRRGRLGDCREAGDDAADRDDPGEARRRKQRRRHAPARYRLEQQGETDAQGEKDQREK
jgi:hypothetical protein